MNQPPLTTLIRIQPSSAYASEETLAPTMAIRAMRAVRNLSECIFVPFLAWRSAKVRPHGECGEFSIAIDLYSLPRRAGTHHDFGRQVLCVGALMKSMNARSGAGTRRRPG